MSTYGNPIVASPNLLPSVADVFSISTAYSAGQYVYYGGKLYQFTADHAAGAWVGTDATAVKLANDVSNLKSAIEAGFPKKSASGAIVTIDDGADNVPVVSLVAQIVPVQSGTGDPAPDNVRPISGFTGANISIMGKKLNNPQWWSLDGKYNEFFGLHTVTSGSKSRGVYMKAGVTYHIHYDNGVSQQYGIYGVRRGSTNQIYLITNAYRRTADVDFTPTVSDRYAFWGYTSADSFPAISTQIFQIEIGNAFTGDAPYLGTSIPITFPDAAGTVYGGTLDVTNGKLTVDRAIKVLNGNSWTVMSSTSNKYYTQGIADAVTTFDTVVSNVFKTTRISSDTTESGIGMLLASGQYRRVGVRPPADSGVTDASSMKTYIDGLAETLGTDIIACYTLVTPIEYDLDPVTVKTLLGINNIWADTGDTTLTYRADPATYQSEQLASAVNTLASMLANVESGYTASKNYSVNDFITVTAENKFYKVTANIASGATITPNTNVTETTVGAELTAILNS